MEQRGLPVPHPRSCCTPLPPPDPTGAAGTGLRSTKIKLKSALEPSWRVWSHCGTGAPCLDSSCFLCSWSFSSPSPAETAQLPPKHSMSNLKCFVKLCQALEEREGGPQGKNILFLQFPNNISHLQWLFFLWFLTFSLWLITQTKITVKIIYFEFISLKHFKPSISLGFILQITWKALGWVILNWNRNRFQNVLQRQNFICVAKWEVAKGEKKISYQVYL